MCNARFATILQNGVGHECNVQDETSAEETLQGKVLTCNQIDVCTQPDPGTM